MQIQMYIISNPCCVILLLPPVFDSVLFHICCLKNCVYFNMLSVSLKLALEYASLRNSKVSIYVEKTQHYMNESIIQAIG